MKKVTKLLITAATVAAVAGVGGVSYAAWSAGTASAPVAATTGSIVTVGSLTATSNIHGSGAKALVPYNQTEQLSTSMTTMADIQFTAANAGEGVTYTIALTSNDKGLTLKYQTGTAEPSTSDIDTGWTAIPTSATTINITPGTTHVYVILVSESATQANDMNAPFTITFAAVAPSAS